MLIPIIFPAFVVSVLFLTGNSVSIHPKIIIHPMVIVDVFSQIVSISIVDALLLLNLYPVERLTIKNVSSAENDQLEIWTVILHIRG